MTRAAVNVAARSNYADGVDQILNMPRISVLRNSGLVIASNTPTYVSWDLVEWDTDGMWDQANPTRLTSRTTGLYAVAADLAWAANTASIRFAQIQKNRAVLYAAEQLTPNVQGLTDPQSVRNEVWMNAGDYVELSVLQAIGVGLAFQAGTTSSRVNGFSACLISLP